MPKVPISRPTPPRAEDYAVVPASQGPRRDFRISVGPREGWDAEGRRVFDVYGAVRTARAWTKRPRRGKQRLRPRPAAPRAEGGAAAKLGRRMRRVCQQRSYAQIQLITRTKRDFVGHSGDAWRHQGVGFGA